MLPPIPQGLVPVTVQQDPVKQRPDTPPITPTQESADSSEVKLGDRESDPQEHARKKRQHDENNEEHEDTSDTDARKEGMSRKGVWVDVKV